MTFPSTAKTLFWTLFGRAPETAADVVISNRYENGTVWSGYQFREHSFTQLCGYLIFGLYHVVAILMLLNTLIAVMVRNYSQSSPWLRHNTWPTFLKCVMHLWSKNGDPDWNLVWKLIKYTPASPCRFSCQLEFSKSSELCMRPHPFIPNLKMTYRCGIDNL